MLVSKRGGERVSTKSHELGDLMNFAAAMLRRAGEEALSYYGRGKHQIKFDEGLVTAAELQLRELFHTSLSAQFPEHQVFDNILSSNGYTHEGKRYLWVYDAIGGVANFQAGIPVWGISIALLENFWPIFGMFYMPVTGDLFQARPGQTAFWKEAGIRVSAQPTLNDESLLLSYSRFHHQYHSTFPGKIRDFGCAAAHVCYVAMGRAEAALVSNETYQGLAAVSVIIEAAGGKIYRFDGSEVFLNDYLDGQRIYDHLLVSPPAIYPQVRNCLRQIT